MPERVRLLNDAPPRSGAQFVIYWALANRRVDANHGVAFAVEKANELGLPLLFYEGLTCDYPYASDRLHTFILEGVADNASRAKELGLGYVFHVRKHHTDPDDALYRLGSHAALIVTDDFPSFIPAHFNSSVPAKIGIQYYAVDSSCIVPMARIEKQEHAAYTIRPKINKILEQYLAPVRIPKINVRWSCRRPSLDTEVQPERIPALVQACEIDHSLARSTRYPGGRTAAKRRLRDFLHKKLRRYAGEAREPSAEATSRLSSYLHFGNISSLEIALAVRKYADEHKLIAAEFLEELIVRRELAYNFARYGPDPKKLTALPGWAHTTLAKHDLDRRDFIYSREQFERAETHDPLWNAAQKELLHDGEIHAYYRMYWGKKIIEWSASHQEALDTMIYLNDRFALDGRDPNTYTNILWCFGLHDRPWAERRIFGTVRYMSYDGMKRKTDVEAYIAEHP